jgi:hypothetical protein
VPIAGSHDINEEAMMHVARVAALVVALATVTGWSGAAAQTSGFTCEDFLTQTAAQHNLERDPRDPYGLDPDGDGIACEDMRANGAADTGRAPDSNAVEEPPDANNDGADVVDEPQVPSQSTQGGVNAEERGYLDAITGIMQPVGEGLIRVGDLVHVPQLVDASWVADVAHHWVRWQSSLDDAIALELPPAFADFHRRYVDAASLLGEASHDITGGLDTGHGALVNEAEAQIGHVNEVIDQVRGMIDALVAEQGG